MAIIRITKASGTVVDLPDPSTFQFAVQDVDASTSGRNQSGYMFRDRLGTKLKVECTWDNIDNATAKTILNAITDTFFKVTCPDPRTGSSEGKVTFTAYVGDRTLPAYRFIDGKWLWSSLTAHFIER